MSLMRSKLVPWVAIALATAGGIVAGVEAASAAGAFTVDSIADATDATSGDGLCATATGVCTVRAAIQEANASGGAVITIPPGTYPLSLSGSEPIDLDAGVGDLDITTDVTIVGAGNGESPTVIEAGAALGDRVVQLHPAGTLRLSRLILRGGTGGNVAGDVAAGGTDGDIGQ